MKNNLLCFLSLKRAVLFTCLFAISFFLSFPQSRKLDSLNSVLKTATDTVKIQVMGKIFGYYYLSAQYDKALKCSEQLQEEIKRSSLSQSRKDNWLANAISNMGSCYSAISDYKTAREYHLKALKLREETHDKKGIANSNNNIGNTYWYQADYEMALKHYFTSLLIREEIGDKQGLGSAYGNIGLIYKNEGLIDKAITNHLAALNIYRELKDKDGISRNYMHIGGCLMEKTKNSGNEKEKKDLYDKAMDYYQKSMKLSIEIDDKTAVAEGYGNIGSVYFSQSLLKEFGDKKNELVQKALEQHLNALKIWQELGVKRGIGISDGEIGYDYFLVEKFDDALKYINEAYKISIEIGNKESTKTSLEHLSELYEEKKDYKQALIFHKKFTEIKDSISNSSLRKELADINVKYETEKRDKEIQLLNLDKESQIAEHKKQNIIIGSVSVVLLLALIFGFFVFRGYRQKKEANHIITAQKEDAEKKTILIEEQKHLVDEKNKDIMDSINYAKKIQEAILPAKEVKYSIFPNGFVLFQPRDIVSGDFYWFTVKDNKRVIAAVDCTGHGVPGAFMSMIGNTFLNEIIEERGITKPGEILSELRHMVIKALKQSAEESESRDGMDMALIVIDDANMVVEYAGANNPIWHFRNGVCTEYKADKRPIGFYRGQGLPFTNHRIEIQKGDTFYLFTDGFADQFGGPKGKKFKYKQFQELLASIQRVPMLNQEKTLLDKFNSWKGFLDQVDDVLVIGIKV